ncbi:MAG: FmdB family transcriptional regulator [Betaproteobacteria bacterium RIFCSPLOWO2_12_FULL_63_13]|nr:MAG: FmdB family transcriptional regulator [Betaproteobacteria bacterium RIFCSPLOWO2_12_FULL_63_13]
MPIYEYECLGCRKEFEILVRESSPPPACPDCSSTHLRKKLSAFAALTSGAASPNAMPAACQTCGIPGGPGACGFQGH